jgi:hypothetical protein
VLLSPQGLTPEPSTLAEGPLLLLLASALKHLSCLPPLLLSLPLPLLLKSLPLILPFFKRKFLLLLLQLFSQPSCPAACCLQKQPDTGAALCQVQVPALLQHKDHQP